MEISSSLKYLAAGKGRIILGYSGGLDSTVLLDTYAKQADILLINRTHVIHIHHGLSPKADEWAQQCADQCKLRNLPFSIIHVNANAEQGESPEAAARNARYKAFNDFMHEDDYLLTAHHQDDQVETFFLQLFRGAGIKGLAGMPVIKNLTKGKLIRPLLTFTRAELKKFAEENNLVWVDDASNFDTNFQRNFLRHDVLPLLKQKWPGLATAVLRTQSLCQESNILLDQVADEDLERCAIRHSRDNHHFPDNRHSRESGNLVLRSTVLDSRIRGNDEEERENDALLNLEELLKLTPERRANLLRYWIAQNNFPLPSQKKLQEIEKTVLHASSDAQPLVAWEGTEIRRYQNNLYLLKPLEPFDASLCLTWDAKSQLVLPNNLVIDASIYEKYKIALPSANTKVTIRFRQGGEVVKIADHHHDLKKLLQESGIPPWQRDRIPLLYHDAEIVAVCLPRESVESDLI